MTNRDLRSEPFETMVALGASNTWGAWASEERFCWPNVLAALISEFQEKPVELHNKGIGYNVISPRCPMYKQSSRPSALERYHRDVIALKPDLVVITYGLNDMRGGTPVEVFREDLATIVRDIRVETSAVILLTSAYYITDYGADWDRGSAESHELYNRCIEQVAAQQDVLFADIYAACKGGDWMLADAVHFTDLGFRVIAGRVFEVIARHCSCLGKAAVERSLATVNAGKPVTLSDLETLTYGEWLATRSRSE